MSTERFAILGSGFGLYGYMPALIAVGRGPVFTLERYRNVVRSRTELRKYEQRLVFVNQRDDLIAHCNRMVIALRPADQAGLLDELLVREWQGALFLEKPVAPTPAQSITLLQRLKAAHLPFRIGFTFLYTSWFAELAKVIRHLDATPFNLTFNWNFCAHHYRTGKETWKRYVAEGGGCLRFYGIHIVALLAALRDWSVVSCIRHVTPSGDEPRFRFTLRSGAATAEVNCDSCRADATEFSMVCSTNEKKLLVVTQADPLENTAVLLSREDRRVEFLTRILESTDFSIGDDDSALHLPLWQDLERIGYFTPA